MTGDQSDMLARLKAVLPLRWFPDVTPVLDGLLTGLASVWATLYGTLSYVKLQTRVSTATDGFLDLASVDYFASALPREPGETDTAFRIRILAEMVRTRATRPALIATLTQLTGSAPVVFEFVRPADTGAWNMALGYNAGGGWGSRNLPFQALVTVVQPNPPLPIAQIQAAISANIPIATIAWTDIQG